MLAAAMSAVSGIVLRVTVCSEHAQALVLQGGQCATGIFAQAIDRRIMSYVGMADRELWTPRSANEKAELHHEHTLERHDSWFACSRDCRIERISLKAAQKKKKQLIFCPFVLATNCLPGCGAF